MNAKPSTVLNRSGNERSILTDGAHTVTYPRAAEILATVLHEWERQGVKPGDCLNFQCEHHLAGALLWLALLESGKSFFVNAQAPCISVSPVPSFCRISVRASWNGDQLKVDARENSNWHPSQIPVTQTVYFRTSGTTGNPKLVAHSVEKLLANAQNCLIRLELKASDRLVIPVPLYHMYGLGAAFLPGALAGASMDIQPGSNLLRFTGREKEFEPNISFLTPTFMQTLVKGRRSPRDYDLTVSAGDLLKPGVFEQYEERFGPVISLYGSTELGAITASRRSDSASTRKHTVGPPMEGVECRIDDRHLMCRHPSGFIGYADERGTVSERDTEEWFPTGDRAQWQDGENLSLLGRLDHSVNRDGILVSLDEIERELETIAGIESVSVIAAGESPRGKGIVAFCVLAARSNIEAEDIRQASFSLMRRGHVPDRVEIVENLPLLPNGKTDRSALARIAENFAG